MHATSALLSCPRCAASALVGGRSGAALACGGCGGAFLPPTEAYRFVRDDVGVAPELVPQLAEEHRVGRLRCPTCREALRALPLKGVEVDWCARCGGLWLDAHERERLSGAPLMTSSTGALADVPEAALGRPLAEGAAGFGAFLGGAAMIGIQQQVRVGEVLFGISLANRYTVSIPGGGTGYALEQTRGVRGVLGRFFLGSHRGLEVDVHDARDNPVLSLTRRPFFVFSDLRVEGADGSLLGHVRRRFAFLWKRYDLEDARGRVFARISSPPWRPWTFPILDLQGRPVACLTKEWGGLLREAYTDADRFTLALGERPWAAAQAAVLFAAALSIDMDFFERNHSS